jgi:hypothetical protein
MLKKARLLTLPSLARRDAACLWQGRSSEAGPRFTFHASRFTVLGGEARTPLANFFSVLETGDYRAGIPCDPISPLKSFSLAIRVIAISRTTPSPFTPSFTAVPASPRTIFITCS